MKITVKSNVPERKLVALVGVGGEGLFLRSKTEPNRMIFLYGDGASTNTEGSLDDLLKKSSASGSDRVPVYEGDTVTLEF